MKRWLGLCLVMVMLLSPLGCSSNVPADSLSDDVATPTSVSTTETTAVTTTVATTNATTKAVTPTALPIMKSTAVKKTTTAPKTTVAKTTAAPVSESYAFIRDAMAKVNKKEIWHVIFKTDIEIYENGAMTNAGETLDSVAFMPSAPTSAARRLDLSMNTFSPPPQYLLELGQKDGWCFYSYNPNGKRLYHKFRTNTLTGYQRMAEKAVLEMVELPSASFAAGVELQDKIPDFASYQQKCLKLSLSGAEFKKTYEDMVRYVFTKLPQVAMTADFTISDNSVEYYALADGKYTGMVLRYTVDVQATRDGKPYKEQHRVTMYFAYSTKLDEGDLLSFGDVRLGSFTDVSATEWPALHENDIP